MKKLIALLLVCAALFGGLYALGLPPFDEESKGRGEASVDANGGTLKNRDGSVVIDVPPDGASNNTRVRFRETSTEEIKDARAVRSIGPAVDVQIISGALKHKETDITLSYDPSQLPKGVGSRQISIAVYQSELGGWVTATDNVTVNSASHTVTLHGAPHYSRYAPVSLDPRKAILKFGPTVIKTIIDRNATVASWFAEAAIKYGEQLIKDLYGVADELHCGNPSKDLSVETRAALRITLEACMNEEEEDSVLKIRNRTALPLRGDIPDGMDINWRRLLANHDDFGQFMQSLAWMPLGQTTVSNASLSDLVVTSEMKSQSTYSVRMDELGWAIDMGIAALGVIQPEVKGLDIVTSRFADEMREATVKSTSKEKMIDGWNEALAKRRGGLKEAAKLATAQAQFATGMSFLNCMASSASNSDRSPSGGYRNVKDLNNKGVKILKDCLNAILGELNLGDMLKSVIGSAKAIPEFLQGQLALQIQPIVDVSTASATVSRFDEQAEIQRFVGEWEAHSATLTINSDGSGKYSYRTYRYCDEVPAGYACDWYSNGRPSTGGEVTFTLDVEASNRAYMVIKSSNSPAEYAVESRIPMRFTEPGVIGYGTEAFNDDPEFGGTTFYEVCDQSRADAGRCGA
ncbi:hypothetical protein ACF08O_08515 [Streptomyces paradoxus]|uniref:hypothetical protein n=1 Tax=Streptomyces paradoxus TaxID=66375 RepID=UPI0036F9FAEE